MSPNRLRYVWPLLCVLLSVALAGSTVHWKKQLRIATGKKKIPAPKSPFDKRAAAYFRELASLRGYQPAQPLSGEDAARLAAYDRLELNKQWAIERGAEPATFTNREQTFAQSTTVPLAPSMRLALTEPVKRYRYTLTNKSDRAQPAPILFRDDRWDSAAAMVEKAGFKSIADEVERAVAIWRFVCARRVYGEPPTEGSEEHDALKFLSIYGYGFCDDSARALATLAEQSGLKSRIWELDGHVVADVMAGGRWRMLDADQQAYFHKAGAPMDILGVEELAADRAAFAHIASFRNVLEYPPKYRDAFLSKESNKVAAGGTAAHRIEAVLRAGEQMAFSNYNWGRYFLGKYPTPPPRFYNGTFTYAFHPRDLTKVPQEVTTEPVEGGFRLSNLSSEAVSIELPFSYPFPIVGGSIEGTSKVVNGSAQFHVEDPDHQRSFSADLPEAIRFNLDYFVAVLTAGPTHRFSVVFTLGPQAAVELRDWKVTSDFQFARLALLPLAGGENAFQVHFPENSKAEDFAFTVSWR